MGRRKMKLAKDALELFMRSLPKDALFSIISFGSGFDLMEYENEQSIRYTDDSRDQALDLIS